MPLIGGPTGQQTGLPVPGVGTPPQTLPEGIEGVPIIVNGQIIGWNIGGEFFTQEEVDALIATGQFPEEPKAPGAAYHPPAWRPGELELEQEENRIARERLQADIAATEQRLEEIRMQEAAAGERQRRQLQAEREMLEVRLENSRRELVYSGAMAERQTLIQEKGRERGRQAELAGKAPFRFAFNIGGMTAPGVTPYDVFKQQGRAFINAPLPDVSMGMGIPELEASLTGMQGMQPPQAGPFTGFAQGGAVESDGAFSTKKQTYLVGDGAGIIPGVTEALTVEQGPFGIERVEVTPLGGVAQGGMTIQSLRNIAQMPFLQNLRLGAELPTGPFGPGEHSPFHYLPQLGVLPWAQSPWAGRSGENEIFGIADRIFRRASAYLVEGRARSIDHAIGMARYREAQSLGRETIDWPRTMERIKEALESREITPGAEPHRGALALPPTLYPALTQMGMGESDALSLSREFGPFARPGKIAGTYGQLDPTEQALTRQLYGLAGVPEEDFLARIQRATPQAGAFGGRRLGFVGGYV